MSVPLPLPASWRRRLRGDDGIVSLELAFGLVLLTIAVIVALNVAFLVFVQGAVRAAAVEGAQAGAVVDRGVGQCQQVAINALDDLVDGADGRIGVRCIETADTMTAIVSGSVEPWIQLLPTINVDARIVVVKEPAL